MATIKSIKEKAKAYDEAIEKFDVILNLNTVKESGTIFAEDVRKILPELKESEDERIIERIKKAVESYWSDEPLDEILAWLEKQGEKVKPIEGFDTEFERQVSYLIASAMNKDYEYTKDFVKWTSDALLNYAKLEIEKNSMGISEATKKKLEDNLNKALEKETPESWNKFLDEQCEQKPVDVRTTGYWHVEDTEQNPVWSEEDGAMFNFIALILRNHQSDEDFTTFETTFKDCIDWLKSLKERYTWKPSDEQMHYLYWIANVKLSDSVVEQEVSKHLNELYQDLKKLKV